MKRSWRKPVAIAITVFSVLVALALMIFVTTRPAVEAMIVRHTHERWAHLVAVGLQVFIVIAIYRTLNAALERIVKALW